MLPVSIYSNDSRTHIYIIAQTQDDEGNTVDAGVIALKPVVDESADNSVTTQINQINTFITMGVDMIVVTPN